LFNISVVRVSKTLNTEIFFWASGRAFRCNPPRIHLFITIPSCAAGFTLQSLTQVTQSSFFLVSCIPLCLPFLTCVQNSLAIDKGGEKYTLIHYFIYLYSRPSCQRHDTSVEKNNNPLARGRVPTSGGKFLCYRYNARWGVCYIHP
jgi:hypothetical protein